MPASRRSGKVVVGEVRRRLHVPVRAEQDPRRGDRPQLLVERRVGVRRPCAYPAWRGSSARSPRRGGRARHRAPCSASSASSRSARVSPMPIRIPLVNGIASSPASRIVSSRAAGTLSGEAQCGPPFSDSRSDDRLEHDPHRRRHGPEQLELGPAHHARIQVRKQPGLVEHAAGAVREVLDRRCEAELARAPRAPPGSAAPACRRA